MLRALFPEPMKRIFREGGVTGELRLVGLAGREVSVVQGVLGVQGEGPRTWTGGEPLKRVPLDLAASRPIMHFDWET